MNTNIEFATFAGGCFWCTEAVFKQIKGVISVTPGYTGGNIENPTYKQVSSGKTGHAEAVQIKFNPSEVSYDTLLEIFFYTHDPTTLNMQGYDKGTQYRSLIAYHNSEQKEKAKSLINTMEQENVFSSPIVTQLVNFNIFYPAEDYHKNYYSLNYDQPYCRLIINPKLEKYRKKYSEKLK